MNWKNNLAESSNRHLKCVFVLGPTASGKSAWAAQQARKNNGSVVNIDSVQFYQGLIVGSAAPTEEEKQQAPHYLYSYVQAPQEMTAGGYITDFYKMIEQQKPKFPLFITGGTGFYIQALEKGMFDVMPIPEHVRETLEVELQQKGAEVLHAELKTYDPESKIHINDHYRLVRALEIIRHTGKKPSDLLEREPNKNALPFESIKIGFDFEKPEFENRVRFRTEKMVAGGLIDETQYFLENGFENWAPLSSVGYKECVQWLKNTTNPQVEDLKSAIQQSTMQLIKKQKTWFKRDAAILWSNHEDSLVRFLS
jgi:tRNA dimethylallyltransferase